MKRIWIIFCLLLLVGCNGNTNENGKNDMSNKSENQNVIEEESNATQDMNDVQEELSKFELESFKDESLNHYTIKATLDVETDVISASQKVEYTNIEGVDLDELYFHLYPNAFTKENHPSLFDSNVDEIDQQIGFLEITELMINGVEVSYKNAPIDTTLKIDYNFIAGETYVIEMLYEVGISSTSERFGVVDGIYNLGNWYPILSVYDEDGWNLDPYYSVGDPFYSDMSNYDVELTLPLDYQVAASGYLNSHEEDDQQILSFRADRMRDFAFVIGNEFKVKTHEIDGTTVYLYYPDSVKGHKWLDDAHYFGYSTIELFDSLIGDYPYKNYSVVITNFPSGMEYPGLVFISDDYFNYNSQDNLREVIVHETVHQWFYSLIGDDEIEEGWIDEGLTSYFTAFYDYKMTSEDLYNYTMKYYKERMESVGLENIEVVKSAEFIYDWNEYGLSAYVTPAVLYHELFLLHGEEKIIEFAKLLYDRHVYGILKETDLKQALSDVYGEEITEFVNTYLK